MAAGAFGVEITSRTTFFPAKHNVKSKDKERINAVVFFIESYLLFNRCFSTFFLSFTGPLYHE
jgi:hypothetical protein